MGTLAADSFQTKTGPEQRLLLANTLNSHPNFAERVAAQMVRPTINKKKEVNNKKEEATLMKRKVTGRLQVLASR